MKVITSKMVKGKKMFLIDDDNYQDGGVIEDNQGQWKYPGQITKINSNNITMKGVPYPVYGVSDLGDKQMMYPNREYKFKGNSVTEYPILAQAGTTVKVEKDGIIKDYDRRSPEYAQMYNSGKLMSYDELTDTYTATPLQIQEVKANAPQWLIDKRNIEKKYTKEKFVKKSLPKWAGSLGETADNLSENAQKDYEKKVNDKLANIILKRNPKLGKSTEDRLKWAESLTEKERDIVNRSSYANKFLPAMNAYNENQSNLTKNYSTRALLSDADKLAQSVEGTPERFRLFPNAENNIESYVNPGMFIGSMAKGLGNVPKDIKNENYGQAALSVATPLSVGAFAGIGNPSTGQFVNRLVNPLAGTGLLNSTEKNIKDKIISLKLNQLIKNTSLKNETSSIIKRINVIPKSTVGVENDFLANMEKQDYEDLVKNIYSNNREYYDLPEITFKSTKPSSYFEDISTVNKEEGLLFKEKFCLPGSECAESANKVNSKIYSDLTGKKYYYNENAHNAWHMEDQMTRHSGIVNPSNYKIGDRVLMGNSVDQSTFVPGYVADKSVRHAGTIAGVTKINDNFYPALFESGKNAGMYLNLPNHTFTGENTIKKIIRANQFIGNEVGEGVVKKNMRYAFRDKPSIANYSSNNPEIQKIINKSEEFRTIIKNNHDITNDEFDILRNNLISIGEQETKLGGKLPGSKLSKSKILIQDILNDLNLTSPIKKSYNLASDIGNMFQKKNKNLPNFPSKSIIEMEAIKLSQKENISLNEAINQIKKNYNKAPLFVKKSIIPSNGMFRQKEQTVLDRLAGLQSDLKNKNSLENALGQMAENFKTAKKLYPNFTNEQLLDITTLFWNSPGKAKNKELVDFFLLGKNNPDITKYNFDYINKINKKTNFNINIQPKRVSNHLELFSTGRNYPEIKYKFGGTIKVLNTKIVNGQKQYLIND